MKGNTKAQCAAYERKIAQALTEAFGEPAAIDDWTLQWRFDVLCGFVELTLPLDSKTPGHGWRDRTLFCRFHGGEPKRYGLNWQKQHARGSRLAAIPSR